MPAFLLSLREGLEAALILGIVLGALDRMGRKESARYVWLGAGAALASSIAIALGLAAAGARLEGRSGQVFEGAMMLLAAAVLTWMIFWMQREGRQMKRRLTNDVRAATGASGSALSLFLLAFMAVFREGVELALFLFAAAFATSPAQTLAGALLGLAAAAGLGLLIFAGTLRLDISLFFRITSLLLIAFAAGMVAYGFHEFVEAGLLPAIISPLYNVNWIVDESAGPGVLLKALFGYNGNPALSETIAYLAYFAVVWVALQRREGFAATPANA